MADFIAVIRRAVDGLTDNTPDMRARVYEKARAAVQRQLENMKPAPPADMLRRQLEKLDAAIRQVEEEHAEALPALDGDLADQVPDEASGGQAGIIADAPAPEPVAETGWTGAPETVPVMADAPAETPVEAPVAAEPAWVAEPAPVVVEPAAQIQAAEPVAQAIAEPVIMAQPEIAAAAVTPVIQEAVIPEPALQQPVARPVEDEDPLAAFLDSMPSQPVRNDTAPVALAPVAEPVPPQADIALPALEPIPAGTLADPFAPETVQAGTPPVDDLLDSLPAVAPAVQAPVVVAEPLPVAEPVALAPAETAATAWPVDIDGEPDVWVDPDKQAEATQTEKQADKQTDELAKPADDVRMPKASFDERDALADFGDLLAPVTPPPATPKKPASDFSWDAPFDDLPEPTKPAVFEQALAARQEEVQQQAAARTAEAAAAASAAVAAPVVAPPAAETAKPAPADPLAELDNLIGFNRAKPGKQGRKGKDEEIPADVSRAVSKLEGKSFRTQPRERGRGLAVIAFAVVILAVLAGAGAAVWMNQDKLMAFVDSLTGPATKDTKTTENAADKPADTAAKTEPEAVADAPADAATEPAKDPVAEASEPVTEAADQPTEVASLDPAGPEKFTQRLLSDGTETAGDGSPVTIEPTLPEGRSEALQTDPGKKGEEIASADPAAAANTADAANPGVVVAQKMFLYEERLGQGTPSALTGSVTWSVKNETGDSGKSEPVIEANLSIPERQMSALVTIKRNSDPSLPASHIIELVFQLPKDFEGGNIESVDRVAMKQTEQDRGNVLIAVPAKITDDFHMIALNDDKDAIANNTELLKSRSWIDIPVTYRNGRRALITLEKGTTGTEAFDKAMREWAALGTAKATP